ncbi:MAG: hypothetical protein RLZZ522_345 [Verrucomicrobiota bacterium]
MKPLATLISGIAASVLCSVCVLAQDTPPPQPGFRPAPPPQPKPPARPTAPPRSSGLLETNGIAAKVNGQVITYNQVRDMLRPIASQLAAQFPRRGPEFERQVKAAQKDILQELIDQKIILDEYKQMRPVINDHIVDEDIKQQIRDNYGNDDAKFLAYLKGRKLTRDAYRAMTRDQLIVQAMRSHQFSDTPPPLPDEVRRKYEEIKQNFRDISKDRISFKKIFIPQVDKENPAATPEDQLTLAENLAKQIKAGADFEELARKHSRDAWQAEGGVQKDVSRMDLSQELAAILFAAKEGELIGPLEEVSPIAQVASGYTLAVPTKLVFGPCPPLEGRARDMVEMIVRKEKTNAQYEKWIEARRRKAVVQLMQ